MTEKDFEKANKAALKALEPNIDLDILSHGDHQIALLNALSHFCATAIDFKRELAEKLVFSIMEDCILHKLPPDVRKLYREIGLV